MQHTRRQHLIMLGGAFAGTVASLGTATAQDATHQVEMLNVDPDDRQQRMLFKPGVLRAQLGDTVKFVASDRGHNAQSIYGMTPDGAEDFRGRINKEIEITLSAEGTYGYLCQPHQTMGMIGFILVGDFTTNLDAVREAAGSLRGRDTSRRVAEYLAEIDAIATDEGLA